MEIRFHLDPETGQPHIFRHDVSQTEVERGLRSEGRASRALTAPLGCVLWRGEPSL